MSTSAPARRVVLVDEYVGHRHCYADALATADLDLEFFEPGQIDADVLSGADLVIVDLELRVEPTNRDQTLDRALKVIRMVPQGVPICVVVAGLTAEARGVLEHQGVKRILRSEEVYHSAAVAAGLLLAALVCNTPSSDGQAEIVPKGAISKGS